MSDLTIDKLKEAYPEIYKAIYDQGFTVGKSLVDKAKTDGLIEGAESERNRIKSIDAYVQEAKIMDHKDLVATLKYDGITTRLEAAEKLGIAEGVLKEVRLAAFTEEHTKLAAPVIPPAKEEPKEDTSDLPPEEQAKLAWNKDRSLRAEFNNDFESYKAYVLAEAAGKVKIFHGKGGN